MSSKPSRAKTDSSAPAKRKATALKPVEAFQNSVAELEGALRRFIQVRGSVLEAAAAAIAVSLHKGGKILIFGNGGSAAEAQHFAAELVNGLSRRDGPALPAIALTTDTS